MGIAGVTSLNAMSHSAMDADKAARSALGGALILVAAILLSRVLGLRLPDLPQHWRAPLHNRGTVLAGAVAGALVGFTSVGSGSLLAPFLLAVFPSPRPRSSARTSSMPRFP